MKKIRKDFITTYSDLDFSGKIEMMLFNYERFPRLIDMEEAKLKVWIKADTEYMRSHNRADLGVRVQTSKLSDPTYDEAVTNINIEETVKYGLTDSEVITKLEDSEEYRMKNQIIKGMKDSFFVLEKVVAGLEEEDKKLVDEYYIKKRRMKDLCDEYQVAYETIRYKVRQLKLGIRNEMEGSLEATMRYELCK